MTNTATIVAVDFGHVAHADPVQPAHEPRYRDVFEQALVAIYVSTPDGTVEACNPAFAQLLGFDSVDEAIGTSMSALYVDPSIRDHAERDVRQGRPVERHGVRLRHRHGHHVEVMETVVGMFEANGTLVELQGHLIGAPRNRDARNDQFRAVFQEASDAMLILDDRRGIVEANAAACQLLGLAPEALIGRSLDSFVLDGSQQLEFAWRQLIARGDAQHEHHMRSEMGETKVVDCRYRAKVLQGRHLCMARDITERRFVERRLMQAEKIESIGRLAGGIAHDFNNLLTSILGYAELLLSRGELSAVDRSDLQEIHHAGRRASALTQQLLAFSHKQSIEPKEIDLGDAIVALWPAMSAALPDGVTLTYVPSSVPARTRIDANQFQQVVLNLVFNARDALPKGGVIRLEIERLTVSPDSLLPGVRPPASEHVRMRVIDNGTGISPEARAHLFEPFFTTKELGKGTGLGLAAVYGIVHQNQGFVTVESEPGIGTAFAVHLPAVVEGDRMESRGVSTLQAAVVANRVDALRKPELSGGDRRE